ncbi:MAG: sulfite exporter TauE/SafE family protein [Kiritimatiellae bacterium]|nr:sulfite exporter TauE/SafE family protein [Kiritimatiellia bacterium]
MESLFGLILLGFGVGAFGTLIGAGGGFILVPVLLLLYPTMSPDVLTAISLAVVCLNAASGSVAYGRMRRIDFKSGLLFAAAGIPGALLGAVFTAYIPRRYFDIVFGALMLIFAAYLLINRQTSKRDGARDRAGATARRLVEADGTVHEFSFDLRLGIALSAGVGLVSSLLGIGGGIVHVPALVRLLDYPVHIATATSHFILAFVALAGTIVHIATGAFAEGGIQRTLLLGVGVIAGAQLGARLSSRVHGVWIIRSLALALAFVGLRILWRALAV